LASPHKRRRPFGLAVSWSRTGLALSGRDNAVHDLRVPFPWPVIERLVSQPRREAWFRDAVLQAYDARCAVTGWKLINGGGRDSVSLRLRRRRGPSGPLGFRAIRRDGRSALRSASRGPNPLSQKTIFLQPFRSSMERVPAGAQPAARPNGRPSLCEEAKPGGCPAPGV